MSDVTCVKRAGYSNTAQTDLHKQAISSCRVAFILAADEYGDLAGWSCGIVDDW